MDNILSTIFISILGAGIILVGAPILVSFIENKLVHTDDILDNIDELASIVETMNDTMNKDSQSKKALDLIISSSEQAVKYAEQIYIAGQISEGQRKEKAVQFVRTVLYDANIDITPDRETLINSTIEAAVFLLPKTTRH